MNQKRTKVVCTLGPASESLEVIGQLIDAGMNVARLNFSHGSYENHKMLFERVHQAASDRGVPVALLQDLQGPKIRVGVLPDEGVLLQQDSEVVFDTAISDYSGAEIPVDYKELHRFLKPGERLLLNDGKMETEVIEVVDTKIRTKVKFGGSLTSHKGINVPDSTLEVRAMSEKDREDARFGVQLGVDFIALSFVRTAEDILDLRTLIEETQKTLDAPQTPTQIIAKIERREAVENIDSILEVVDGIMVARGDLGIEMPAEEVPLLQKDLITRAIARAKPVIVATQMLDSMQENSRPTRAEVSDVANAVIDHTDAVMLSNESAVGKFPIETVQTMSRILFETEKSPLDDLPFDVHAKKGAKVSEVMEHMARLLADQIAASAVVLFSSDGASARRLSSFRPELPLIIGVSDPKLQRQMNLSWGVYPILTTAESSVAFESEVRSFLLSKNIPIEGKSVIFLEGKPFGSSEEIAGLEVRLLS